MQLLIPKEEAVSILNDRIRELWKSEFNSKVWLNTTIIDIKQIFGTFSDQHNQMSIVNFETSFSELRNKVLLEAKTTSEGLLRSYVNQIEKYSKIELQRKATVEGGFQRKYQALVTEYTNEIQKHVNSNEIQTTLKTENLNLSKELDDALHQNQMLINNTLQLDNITLKNLWKAILNLPAKSVWAIVGILLALLTGAFLFGEFIQSLKK